MSPTKIVAMLIPIIALVIWACFFIIQEARVNRFYLTIVLIPAMLASFYIALRVWRMGRAKSAIVRS